MILKLFSLHNHGTSNIAVRTCLTRLGYDLVPVLAQCAPDPDFSNTKSPNPEVPASYELAIKKSKKKLMLM